ncbi:hypothetical protein [Arenibacter certesii]|uniref:Uncharacterized protein n=1 Tax=Arenibacter certesii TaxID=228955 RepID=A0A918J5U6_9FLAO|nr:hypothetical protein [Arenibacter certesii]GGW50024.1 hypothetical protein GCM10007383_37420 [Arenibacter certesii]
MKNLNTRTLFSITTVLSIFILIMACSKDFENIILDSFDFSFTGEHDQVSFLFENTRTSFTLTPEKEITTVDYYVKYSPSNIKGYFVSMKGDTIRPNDTLQVTDRHWNYNFIAIDTGLHRVRFMAWDSNANTKELELVYNAKYASFSFMLNKGVNEFIINSKNPINATLLRDKETGDPNNKSEFEITYQIENGTGKVYLDDKIFDAGKPFFLLKGISELSYLPETLGTHKLIITAKAPDGAILTEELLLKVVNLNFTINTTAAS